MVQVSRFPQPTATMVGKGAKGMLVSAGSGLSGGEGTALGELLPAKRFYRTMVGTTRAPICQGYLRPGQAAPYPAG